MERGRTFRVVFFDVLRDVLWNVNTLLARAVVIQHLKNNTKIDVWCTSNWWTREWQDYLVNQLPAFVLLSGRLSDADKSPVAKTLSECLMLSCMAADMRCIRSREISFHSSFMRAFECVVPPEFGDVVAKVAAEQELPMDVNQMSSYIYANRAAASQTFDLDQALLERLVNNPLVSSGNTRLAFIATSCVKLLKSDIPFAAPFTKVLLLHTLLQLQLPLAGRCLPLPEDLDCSDDSPLFTVLTPLLASVHASLLGCLQHSESQRDPLMCDVLDGRLVFKLAGIFLHNKSHEASTADFEALAASVPQSVGSQLDGLWRAVSEAAGRAAEPLTPWVSADVASKLPVRRLQNPSVIRERKVEGHTDSELVRRLSNNTPLVDAPLIQEIEGERRRDIPGWNSGLILQAQDDDAEKAASDANKSEAFLEKKARKQDQGYMMFLTKYSQSLEGGNTLVQRHVTIVAPQAAAEETKKPKHGGGGGKQPKNAKGKLSAKDAIKAKVLEKQAAASLEAAQRLINVASAEPTLDAKLARLTAKTNVELNGAAQALVDLQSLAWCGQAWLQSCQKPDRDFSLATRVFRKTWDIWLQYGTSLAPEQITQLQQQLLTLGLPDSAAHLMAAAGAPAAAGKKESKRSASSSTSSSTGGVCSVNLSSSRFQLLHCGHVMARDVNAAPDARVPDFLPDAWQRDLLNVVDKNQSALVVAPTSAGKTFASYYTMKKILLDNKTARHVNERGVVVYVSPTKALVMQVSAEVYKRFGPVFGTYTNDYKYKELDSEVLITVPERLESLMLSSEPDKLAWAKRVKYVIFDEVHQIGAFDGGEIWEHLLLLVRCPYLALSATVGNAERFHAWLQNTQNIRHRQVKLVRFHTRWSDLEKSVYLPHVAPRVPPLDRFDLQNPRSEMQGIVPMHSCAVVKANNLLDGFPPDLSMSPKECVQLFDILAAVDQGKDAALTALAPDAYFPSGMCINKRDVAPWETALKNVMVNWAQSGRMADVEKVLETLNAGLDAGHLAVQQQGINLGRPSQAYNALLPMLLEMKEKTMLPAIIFCFDRVSCDKFVETMLNQLETMEKDANRDKEGVLKKLQKDIEKEAKAAKRARDAEEKKSTKGDKKQRQDGEREGKMESGQDGFEASATKKIPTQDNRFSFTNDLEREWDDKSYWVDRILWKTKWPADHYLMRALERGIGVHHPGHSADYIRLVEVLFRTKVLKVVISTGTLALGINMPCRSVIFALDSPFLDPLNYRQMSGRAGRRGYDDIGNVIFFGIPPRKVNSLVTSPLTTLSGCFPLNTTLVLRMLILYHLSTDKEFSADSLRGLLEQPFFSHSQDGARYRLLEQVRHHLFFSLEYLFDNGLITRSGAPINLAGLANHLYLHEPANYLLVSLIQSGAVATICEDYEDDASGTCRRLLKLLCHVVNRIPVPSGFTRESFVANTPSKLILKPLKPEYAEVVNRHNAIALDTFIRYCRTFARTIPASAADHTLPLSNVAFPQGPLAEGGLLASTRFVARSAFTALSGQGDSFGSVRQLVMDVRPGIWLEESGIPVCEWQDMHGRPLPLNRYAVDFLKHGNLDVIANDNGLADKAWEQIKEVSIVLKSLKKAVAELNLDNAPGNEHEFIIKALTRLSKEFNDTFKKTFK
eukprot:gnl/Hemi2/14832_TR5030_c0_g1_i1.p1 gnl/Hemi2/14832_TR5030_c0_g1~~gnl/Hemi2/14832_TR5030_c0_g1_i1.p1  ORF type:complete len:1741 (+),score=571.48 gnl/Hemi2/14832_TR5030_c0_g1_i1:323-5224(+)